MYNQRWSGIVDEPYIFAPEFIKGKKKCYKDVTSLYNLKNIPLLIFCAIFNLCYFKLTISK